MILQSHSWAGENHNSKRYMQPNVHTSAIYNRKDTEVN